MVLESQLPHKIVNLLVAVGNKTKIRLLIETNVHMGHVRSRANREQLTGFKDFDLKAKAILESADGSWS